MLKLNPSEPESKRDQLLSYAEESILQKGFSATSIDELIEAVGISKSGFFYHFRDKGELATALLDRYIENEKSIFEELFRRADSLSDDPLQSFLIFLRLFSEMMSDLPAEHPGCIIASYCYQDRLFDGVVRKKTADNLLRWRSLFREKLDAIAETHPPKVAVDLDGVADMMTTLVDGGIILSKVIQDKYALPRQIEMYRTFVKTIFQGTD